MTIFFQKCAILFPAHYIYIAHAVGNGDKAGFEISGNAMGHVRRGAGENVEGRRGECDEGVGESAAG